jgi:hypothetical protein
MKRKKILSLFFVLMFVFAVYSGKMTFLSAQPIQKKQAKTETSKQVPKPYDILIKTYHLKFIKPIELRNAARFYITDSTAYKDTITVKIFRMNISKFEELLKKLDVEKKAVLFKVFTVIASKEKESESQEGEVIENRSLKKVLDELRNLWNFKSYKVDGPSFLAIKEGSGSNYFRLVSSLYTFNLNILHVNVKGEESRKRVVSVGQIQLSQTYYSVGKEETVTLIDTHDVSFKEKGFLVVGISGFRSGRRGNALILVINAEIK